MVGCNGLSRFPGRFARALLGAEALGRRFDALRWPGRWGRGRARRLLERLDRFERARLERPLRGADLLGGVLAVALVEEALDDQGGVGARREGEGDVDLPVAAVELVRGRLPHEQLVRVDQQRALLALEEEELA